MYRAERCRNLGLAPDLADNRECLRALVLERRSRLPGIARPAHRTGDWFPVSKNDGVLPW